MSVENPAGGARLYPRDMAPTEHPAGELHIPSRPVRVVTATSLFDGHDAAINIMRRILQSQGAECFQHLTQLRSFLATLEFG